MRKFIVAIMMVLSLAGCTLNVGGDSPSTAPSVESSETLSSSEKDEVFLQTVREEYDFLYGIEDRDLIEMVESTCSMFDSGVSSQEILEMIIANGADQETGEAMAFVIGAGTAVYCPEHTGKITDSTV